MERDPIRNEVRKLVRRRRVGEQATCMLCGETDPDVLIENRSRRIVENHHVVSAANEADLTGPLCLNDHRKVHVLMEEAGVDLQRDDHRTFLEALTAILLALSVFFAKLGETLREWADLLRRLIGELDKRYPAWRRMPGAKR